MSNFTIYYHPDTITTAHVYDTTRKGQDIAYQLQQQGIPVTVPTPLTPAEAWSVHDRAYITAIQTGNPRWLAESQGFPWDSNMWRSVAAQNGAMRDATLAALAGTPAYALSAGFHHARANTGLGNCTCNGVALAASIARSHGARRIFILDVDAHCGGGTYSMVHQWSEVQHIDISTNLFDRYTPNDQHRLYGVDVAETYLDTLEYALMDAALDIQPNDVLIYNAGMDPYEHCRVGGLTGITASILAAREVRVAAWARTHQLRMLACLAGGYSGTNFPHQQLVDFHCHSIRTFLHIDA